MITGLLLILAGLLLAIFSGPIAKFHIAMNKRLLGVELPFEWSRAAGVFVGALVSFTGILKLLQLPPL
jgi:TRAP-type C4-dicarboxylate transport system permease small subunit